MLTLSALLFSYHTPHILPNVAWRQVRTEMVVDKGLAADVADKIGLFVLQSGAPKDLWATLTSNKTFGDHSGDVEYLHITPLLFLSSHFSNFFPTVLVPNILIGLQERMRR